jgi:SAM-dependent methyltransferase
MIHMSAAPDSPWSSPETVAGFAQSPPNDTLMAFAAAERRRGATQVLDIGCGAARNAAPLAEQGWDVVGLDLSVPMIAAARQRVRAAGVDARVHLAVSTMDALPVAAATADLIVAHGIWNLASSGAQFRRAVAEAARAARPDAALFLFTFSRQTIAASAAPVAGETFVFTQFAGQPQCFLTAVQIVDELGRVGFASDSGVPLTELNLPRPGSLSTGRVPVIFQGAFRASGVARPQP